MKKSKEEKRLIKETVKGLNLIRKEDLVLTKDHDVDDNADKGQYMDKKILYTGSFGVLLLGNPYPFMAFYVLLITVFILVIKWSYTRFSENQEKEEKKETYETTCRKYILNKHYPAIQLAKKWMYTKFRLRKFSFYEDSFLPMPSYVGQNKEGAKFTISPIVKEDRTPFGLMVSLKLKDFSVKKIVVQHKSLKSTNQLSRHLSRVKLKRHKAQLYSKFSIFSSDKEEAKKLFSPSFLEPLLDLYSDLEYSIKWEHRIIWNFTKNEINLIILSKEALFRLPSNNKTLIQWHHVDRFMTDMDEALGFLAKLDLQSTKIPKNLKEEYLEKQKKPEIKRVDDSPYDHLIDNT